MERISISEAARLAGVHPRTLMAYEQRGLVHPRRHPVSGWRLYERSDIERLRRLLDGAGEGSPQGR